MTDEEYVTLKAKAENLLQQLRDFPARPFLEEARRRGNGEFGAMVWATRLEAIPDPTPTPDSDPSKSIA
jgi:hypothetical protein